MKSDEPTIGTPIPSVAAAIVSVGGSPAPVLFILREKRPAHVWYFCSAGSRENADAIQQQLDWNPQSRFIEVVRFEELGPCYKELRRTIPEILAETRIRPEDVLVDYTGGTKTMSAALVLAAAEMFQQFSYVGGEQREKGGLGVTVDGRERLLYQDNPWGELAVREVERACDLWRGCQYEDAARILREVAGRVPKKIRFETIADLAGAMAARHRLDFRDATRGLGNVIGKLAALFDGRGTDSPVTWVEESIRLCHECSKDSVSDMFMKELLDNTLRTAGQGRYEDAAARLYRAMEMQAQIWLAQTTDNLFVNGRIKAGSHGMLPEVLKGSPYCQPDERGEIRLSMERSFHVLALLDHERAKVIVGDLVLMHKSRWRTATEKRNSSILAHGVAAIREEGFAMMKDIATEYLGFDLTKESYPVPALNPQWLES